MIKKPSRITVLLDPSSKKEFEAHCAKLGTNPSMVLRELISRFIDADDKASRLRPVRPPAGRTPREDETH